MSKNQRLMTLLFASSLGLSPIAAAQEPAPASTEDTGLIAPESEAPKVNTPTEAIEPATAKPAAPKAAAAKTEPAKPEPVKELTPCAKALTPLADSYKKAYEDMQKWIANVDAQTTAVNDKIEKIQDQIQQNEAAITKAKLAGDNQAARDLAKDNKQLWADLNASKKEKVLLCSGFARETAQKVKEYSTDIAEKLQQTKSQMK